jgi:hypothetical protein
VVCIAAGAAVPAAATGACAAGAAVGFPKVVVVVVVHPAVRIAMHASASRRITKVADFMVITIAGKIKKDSDMKCQTRRIFSPDPGSMTTAGDPPDKEPEEKPVRC